MTSEQTRGAATELCMATAEISVIASRAPLKHLRDRIAEAADAEAERSSLFGIRGALANPYVAAARGYVAR